MISETVKKQIVEAMKAKDEIRLSTLKLLSAALTNAEFAKRAKVGADPKAYKLTEEEKLEVVRREAKKRKDAIEAYEKAGETERVEKEKKELEILKGFLPKEISDKELRKLVEEAISAINAGNIEDVGRVIGYVKSKAKGRADGKRVSDMVRSRLS
jgi:uncharacterized protein YqeY